MVKLFRSNGLALEGGVLVKPQGSKEEWNSHALLDVADSTHFSLSIEVLQSENANSLYGYIVGIAPTASKLNCKDIEEKVGAFMFFAGNRVRILTPVHLGRAVIVEYFPTEITTKRLQLTFMGDSLYLAYEGNSRVKVVDSIPEADYRPCISLMSPGSRLRVSVNSPARKRKPEYEESMALNKALWINRPFPDAVVECVDESIPVHRGVLAAASPFFAAAFKSGMREGCETHISIKDASSSSVKAFLQYLYTNELVDEDNLEDLLRLAHRYEANSLLKVCASAIVETISRANVVSCVATLRPLRSHPVIEECWANVFGLIQADEALLSGLMEGCHTKP